MMRARHATALHSGIGGIRGISRVLLVSGLRLSMPLIPLLPLPQAAVAQTSYDLIIRNGRVLDGTGNPWFTADIAVRGDRIAAVGNLSGARAARVIDATGLYVAPGFIDVHSHSGPALATPELSGAEQLLAQGITTVFVNPDGGGPVDLAGQKAALLKNGLGVNVAQLAPHGSVRGAVLGMQDRAPDRTELDRMRQLVRSGMEAGAFGLSSGPFYAPGSFSRTEELVELARVAAEFGGAYTSHIRDESDYTIGVVAAVDEVIRIAREARLPGVVTHIKALGPRVWGYSLALVYRIDRARSEGVEVYADQYPYEASATSLTAALVPRWAEVGGDTALERRLRTPAERARIRGEMLENLDRRGGAARLQFRRHRADPSIEGRALADVARDRGKEPVDAALDLIAAGGVGVVSFNMNEADIETLMRQPWTMTASDGDLVAFGDGVPHPRGNGTFPRKIRRYVLDKPVVDLAFAIRSMTALPASVFRMADRGMLRPGAAADVVVLDLQRIRDAATYDRPHQLAEGMVYVLVNGGLAVDQGRANGAKHGRVLNRQAMTGDDRR
ncbi:MAG: amidohydrolase family protein [Gemmatimonadetes bacterium]|nr:amidohydrolase family protein [Gemmatimonadota bacterium]